MIRTETRPFKIGALTLGHQNRVLIQSMCNIKTSSCAAVIAQINACADLGADYMRVSVMDEDDALAIKTIKASIKIPLVADIHFDYRLAILAMENGIDKIRINPGNIGSLEKIKLVVDCAKRHHVGIRIGVNSGSLDDSVHDYKEHYNYEKLVASAQKHVKILEQLDFYDIAISLKGSDVLETIKAYRLASAIFPYPLHLGITEAGTKDIGIIRSVAGLAPLLLDGIGDTIRISLTDEPEVEIITAKRLLHDLGLYPNYPTLISCPTCGRTRVNVQEAAQKVLAEIEKINRPITVAVMGCVVNGPGEAKNADYGLAGGLNQWVLFKKGQIVKTVPSEKAVDELIALINS